MGFEGHPRVVTVIRNGVAVRINSDDWDGTEPVAETVVEAGVEPVVEAGVETVIPDDWQSLSVVEMKKLASALAGVPASHYKLKSEAIEAINFYASLRGVNG